MMMMMLACVRQMPEQGNHSVNQIANFIAVAAVDFCFQLRCHNYDNHSNKLTMTTECNLLFISLCEPNRLNRNLESMERRSVHIRSFVDSLMECLIMIKMSFPRNKRRAFWLKAHQTKISIILMAKLQVFVRIDTFLMNFPTHLLESVV